MVKGLSSGSSSIVVMLPNPNNTTLPSNYNFWPSNYEAVSTVISAAQDGGRNVATLDKTYDIAKVLRITRGQYRLEKDYAGFGTNSNPVSPVYLMVGFGPWGSSTAGTMQAFLQLTFETEFFNPYQLSS
jgi:hypothetical protein